MDISTPFWIPCEGLTEKQGLFGKYISNEICILPSSGFLSFEELSTEKEGGEEEGGIKRIKRALEEREFERSERKRKGGHEAWVWHDEDELLAYENLYEDFHQR